MAPFEQTLITVITTAVVSTVVAIITTRLEIRKHPYEIRKIYADNLHKKRIEKYPAFYELISELTKNVNRGLIDKEYLTNWLEKFLKLDSEIAIFFSGTTVRWAFGFYRGLEDLMIEYFSDSGMNEDDFSVRFYELKPGHLENTLKKDLGIYDVEFDPKKGKLVTDYDELDKILDNK